MWWWQQMPDNPYSADGLVMAINKVLYSHKCHLLQHAELHRGSVGATALYCSPTLRGKAYWPAEQHSKHV
jgi:hypothetical protein